MTDAQEPQKPQARAPGPRARTRALLARYHPLIRRGLGQHFLVDGTVLERILQAAELTPTDVVIEVGPGLGTLTTALQPRVGHLIAIERDPAFLSILREALEPSPTLHLLEGDILHWPPVALLASAGLPPETSYKVVANLPYAIAAPALRHFLEGEPPPTCLVVMLQREVARAITDPDRHTLLAISVRFYATPRLIATVPPRAFYPPPQVHSAVLRLDVHPSPPPLEAALFFPVVRAGFSAPRQQLRNALARGLALPPAEAARWLEDAAIDHRRRAETLSVEEWVGLARLVPERPM